MTIIMIIVMGRDDVLPSPFGNWPESWLDGSHPWEPLLCFSHQSPVTQKVPFVLVAWTSPASPSGLCIPMCGITWPGSSVEYPARSSPCPRLAPEHTFPQDCEGRWRGPLQPSACAFFSKSYLYMFSMALVTRVCAFWQFMRANDTTLNLRSGM